MSISTATLSSVNSSSGTSSAGLKYPTAIVPRVLPVKLRKVPEASSASPTLTNARWMAALNSLDWNRLAERCAAG